jgi:hypothetical protein
MLKGRTDYEKGEAYLQLSLASLRELASLLENERLSASQKASYVGAYTNSKRLYDETTKIRDQLLQQKKSFRKIIINFFVRDPDARRFHRVSYWSYSSIKSTSDGLNRLLLPDFENSAQGNDSIAEESLRNVVQDNLSGVILDVHTEQEAQETRVAVSGEEDEEDDRTRSPCDDAVEGNILAEDVSSNENLQDINLDLHTEQEVQEAFEIFGRLGTVDKDEDDDDDGSTTIRPSPSQSRAPSPGPICNINIYINQSVVSFDSESIGTTLNVGVNEGVGSALG